MDRKQSQKMFTSDILDLNLQIPIQSFGCITDHRQNLISGVYNK